MTTLSYMHVRLAAAVEGRKTTVSLFLFGFLMLIYLLTPPLFSFGCCLLCIYLLGLFALPLLVHRHCIHETKLLEGQLDDENSQLGRRKRQLEADWKRIHEEQRRVDSSQHWLDSRKRKSSNTMNEIRDHCETQRALEQMKQKYEKVQQEYKKLAKKHDQMVVDHKRQRQEHLEAKREFEKQIQSVATPTREHESGKQQAHVEESTTKYQLNTVAGKKGKLQRFGSALKQKVKRGCAAQEKTLVERRSQQLAVVTDVCDQKLAEQKARLDDQHEQRMAATIAILNAGHETKIAQMKADMSAQYQKALAEARPSNAKSEQEATEVCEALECRVMELEDDLASTNALATKMTGIDIATLNNKFLWSSKHADSLFAHHVGGDTGVLLQACIAYYEAKLATVMDCTNPLPTPESCTAPPSPSPSSILSDVPDDLSDMADYNELMALDDPIEPSDPNEMECDTCS